MSPFSRDFITTEIGYYPQSAWFSDGRLLLAYVLMYINTGVEQYSCETMILCVTIHNHYDNYHDHKYYEVYYDTLIHTIDKFAILFVQFLELVMLLLLDYVYVPS